QFRLAHRRAAMDVAPLRLGIEFGPRLASAGRFAARRSARAALLLVARGLAATLLRLGAAQIPLVLRLALVFRGARLVEGDRDRLSGVLHLAAARLELAMLELVHDASDRLLLTSRLLCHLQLRCAASARDFGGRRHPPQPNRGNATMRRVVSR